MTLLKSREIVSTLKSKSPPESVRKEVIEPTTPSKTLEPLTQWSNNTTPSSSSLAPIPYTLGLGLDLNSVSVYGTFPRRSARLASKSSSDEMRDNAAILCQKRKNVVATDFNSGNVVGELGGSSGNNEMKIVNGVQKLGVAKVRFSERNGRKSGVLEEKEGIVEKKMGLGDSISAVEEFEVVRGVGEFGLSSGSGSLGESKGKGKRKLGLDVDLSGLELVGEGEKSKRYLNLRSGKKIAKRGMGGIGGGRGGGFGGGDYNEDDEMVHENEKSGNYKESMGLVNDGGGEGVMNNESERGLRVEENGSVKGRRRFTRKEKGKGKYNDQALIINGVHQLKLDSGAKVEISIGNAVSDAVNLLENFDSEKDLIPNEGLMARRRFSREEKGKGKLVGDELVSKGVDAELVLESKVEKSLENIGSDAIRSMDKEISERVHSSRRGYRERFRDVARQNASRFAHFSSQEGEENDAADEAATEMRQREAEDWPGPFSTAMKIIRDREVNVNAQQTNSSSAKSRSASVVWVPRRSQQLDCSKQLVPSLQELCMTILAKNADAITSLDIVPDILRHKLTQLLCDSRRMNDHFLNLLVSKSPTEIRVRDCSWLTEEQFMKNFEGCDTNNLTVLQLDQCGRCMPDYILFATLDRLSNSLPVLTTISLKGACRLSDVGLSALVSSAPALRSVNLSQCSLLTLDGINSLANSLGSVLRELYIDDCQSIDAMLILPALSKLEHLEVLSVAGIQTVCDDFVSEFVAVRGQNMKELLLTNCVNLTDTSLKVIAEYCPGLYVMDLTNLCKLTDSAIGYLANGCGAIQTLRLCRNGFSDEAVAAYIETCGQTLKELSLNNVNKVADNTAISLARCSRNLISLDLSWCRNLTDEALGLIVDSCLSLKVLKIFGCTQITNVFLDGHSNPQVRIIGLKMAPILEHLKVPDLQGPLHYSSVSSPMLPFHFYTNYHSPSPSFNELLNSCFSLSELKRIHGLILTNGSHRNLFLSTKLINLACSLAPTMEYARKLFDKMPQRDVFLWNTLIRGYADLGPCREAIVLYRNMHQSGLLPDNYTFPFVVRSCAVLSALREGTEVHCNIIKNGFDMDVFVKSSLVTMYSESGETWSSELVFDEMVVRNIVSWTAMISAYVQNGFFDMGLGVFREMMASGTRPNAVTLVSILPACAGLEFLNLGMLIHGYGMKLGVDSEISLVNALIALYGKCGNIDIARYLFDQMAVRSVVSWNAMIAAYEHNNAGADAVKLFRLMQTQKVEFDYITMVSVISACASLGASNTGKWVHELVRSKGFENNNSVTNALIDMYAKCGNIDLARGVFERLPNKNVVAWTSIIGACASHGHGQDALMLFSKMKEEGIRPNSLTFTAVLTACRHSGLVEEGRKHFESMTRDYSIVPGVEQCACMVDLLGRADRLMEAYEFIENMPNHPDVSVWGALLGACRIHGNLELAELVADRLFHFNPQTVSFYVLMINIYAEAGRWEDVARLRKLMEARELKKIPGQSLVEVNRRFHMFLSGSRSKLSRERFIQLDHIYPEPCHNTHP
ncbi:unnamed protein product [Ilex paraguariensis]|uniref:Uncharacterized protein n=1 Tax=Ilex paraguariensis TaxID=185542 RepID=A0ABC8RJ35_9AQUA